jgi:hypothetical protein
MKVFAIKLNSQDVMELRLFCRSGTAGVPKAVVASDFQHIRSLSFRREATESRSESLYQSRQRLAPVSNSDVRAMGSGGERHRGAPQGF